MIFIFKKGAIMKLPLMLAVLVMAFATPSQAQNVTKITEGKVKAYYNDLSGLFKKPYPQFVAAYGERIHPDLSLTTRTQIIVPGQSPVETEPTIVKKNDLVANAERAYKAAKDAVLTTKITNVTIASDGKTAQVKTVSTIKGMNFPTSDDAPMKADSLENCDDVIALNESGALQITQSNCTSQITILN